MLRQWCTNVMRSKVEPMKELARMIYVIDVDVAQGREKIRLASTRLYWYKCLPALDRQKFSP